MTPEEKRAYEWALNQKFNSVAASYARILAQYIQRAIQIDDSIIGKQFLVESPDFEGVATALGVNNDDTVRVQDDYSGEIHTVNKEHLIIEF